MRCVGLRDIAIGDNAEDVDADLQRHLSDPIRQMHNEEPSKLAFISKIEGLHGTLCA